MPDCIDGTFGQQCENRCYCANNVPCDKNTGECPSGGCQPGYVGSQCAQGNKPVQCLKTHTKFRQ